jgi:hypothetical protein
MFVARVGIAVCAGWGAFVLLDNVPEFQPGGDNQISSSWVVVLVSGECGPCEGCVLWIVWGRVCCASARWRAATCAPCGWAVALEPRQCLNERCHTSYGTPARR